MSITSVILDIFIKKQLNFILINQFLTEDVIIMQKNKIIFYSPIFIIALQICFHSSVIAFEQTVPLNTVTPLSPAMNVPISEALQVMENVGNCYFFIRNVYELGKNSNKFLNPSQERQDQIQNIQEQLKLIKLKRNFATCLVENRTNTKKGSLKIPSECEHAAFLLGGAGAINEAERMVVIFRNHTT